MANYEEQVKQTDISVKLNIEQAAAIIKAHDYGIANLKLSERALIDEVMSTMKFQIAD